MHTPAPTTTRTPERARPIVLIGFMGCGKSTVGRRLARRLGTSFADADAEIERVAGRTIAEIFAMDGEPAFRAREHGAILGLLDPDGPGVLALGGGAAMHPGTRQELGERARVVHLRVSLARALERVGDDPGRPMLARPDLARLHADRTEVYDRIADMVVDVDDLAVESVVSVVARLVAAGADRAGPRPRGVEPR